MSDGTGTSASEMATPPGRGKKVQSFAGTGSRVLGVVVLAIAALALLDIVIEWRTLQGLSAAAVTVSLSTLVWMSMVRPAVVIYDRAVVLRNFVRDIQVPWHLMAEVEVKPVLTVTVEGGEGQKAYRSIAVAASAADRRAEIRAQRQASKASAAGVDVNASGPADPSARRPSEQAVERIRAVAERNLEDSRQLPEVERRWVAPELIVLFVSGLLGFLTSLA